MPIAMHHSSNHRQHHIGRSPRQHFDELSNQTNQSKARIAPTITGAVIGAALGRMLPFFGIISGAFIGGMAGKYFDHHQSQQQSKNN